MVFTTDGVEARRKIAAFDMDGTIIRTKSGHVFPKNSSDWKIIDDRIIHKLRSLHGDDDYKVVFFSNQNGIGKHVTAGDFKRKVEAIVARIGVPIQVFLALTRSHFRKPRTGMWDHLNSDCNGGLQIAMDDSFFVGDAAGRHRTKKRPVKDHSTDDRFFADNVGLKFYTPEQFFFGEEDEEPWGPITSSSHRHTTHRRRPRNHVDIN